MATSAQTPTLLSRIASLPPILKLLAWAGGTFAVTSIAQLLLCAVGAQQQMYVQPPRGLTAITALIGLAILAATERRPMADYGLAVPEQWGRQLAAAFGGGAGLAAVWCLLCYVCGIVAPREPARWGALFEVLPVVIEALIATFAVQIIFSGYIFSMLREHHHRATAVVTSALLLPFMYRIDTLPAIVTHGQRPTLSWMFAIQLLAGVLRLRSGHILVATGLIAGIASVRRLIRKTGALETELQPELAFWLYPANDLLLSPVLWFVIVVVAFVLGVTARPRAASRDERPAGIPSSLKQVYPFATPVLFVSLDVYLRCLWIGGGHVARKYVPRAIAIFVLSTINTVLSLPERLIGPILRRRRPLAPVFVVGTHRSGTTHLHNLLALDPQLIAPMHFQVLNPVGALVCGLPMMGVMTAFFPWRRPMDNMSMHPFSPGEEEFAVANLCPVSPYWGWVFPKRAAAFERFLLPSGFTPHERSTWTRAYRLFVSKLVFWTGRRPVLKNPCNTGRLAMLLEMYPNARIVHIHRHPHDVYCSNLRFARDGHCLFQLQDPVEGDAYADRFLATYAEMEAECYRVAETLPPARFVDVRFEDLETDVPRQIRRIYAQLELEFSEKFSQKLRHYLDNIADYRKNRFAPLGVATQREIERHVGPLMQRWGYDTAAAVPDAAP